MSDVCQECGRPKPVPIGAPHGNTVSRCFVGWYDGDCDWEAKEDAFLDCKNHTIKQLRAEVQHLQGELENYDTTDAQNHAVGAVVKALTRILDEGRQVGRFGGAELQALAERLLQIQQDARGEPA